MHVPSRRSKISEKDEKATSMSAPRVVLGRLLARGTPRLIHGRKVYSNMWIPQRLQIAGSFSIIRLNSTISNSKETTDSSPAIIEHQSGPVESESKSTPEDVHPHPEEAKGNIKKVPKRIDFAKDGRKDTSDDRSAIVLSNEPASIPRKIKIAKRQRRQEERAQHPQKNPARKSLRRVGSDASHPREVLEEVIQQAEMRQVHAYCVSEAFSFPKLRHLLGDHGYYPFTNLSEDCIHVTSDLDGSETGDIFFFMDGTIVTWGLSDEENLRLIDQIKSAEIEPYRDVEEEELDFIQDPKLRTGIMGETILIGREQDGVESSIYAKLAFSNGIARSTKLAVLEEQLDNYLDSTREIPRILARGNKLPWGRQKTLQKVGELLAFRGELNLHSELVETPDLYWAKPQLEEYYNRISKILDVAVRITILNKKLDYANELAATLRSHLSEKHGLALEWGIIGLIAIEVVFGIIELVG